MGKIFQDATGTSWNLDVERVGSAAVVKVIEKDTSALWATVVASATDNSDLPEVAWDEDAPTDPKLRTQMVNSAIYGGIYPVRNNLRG